METKGKQKSWLINYRGQILSANNVRSNHWRKSKSQKDAIQITMMALILQAKVPKVKNLELSVRYNSRHDIDGIAPMIKYFVDALVKLKKICDDSPKYWKQYDVNYDEVLEKGTIEFKVKSK